jgi:hypothetical protein
MAMCKVPESGGTLIFPNVDVILRPAVGDVVCYYESKSSPIALSAALVGTAADGDSAAATAKSGEMQGYTRNKMCPAFEGEHRWATIQF